MAARENTAINNLVQLVAARRATYEVDHDDDRVVAPPPPVVIPSPPPTPAMFVLPPRAFEEDDEEAQTHFVERYQGPIPEATPQHAWSPADMRSTAERISDVVSLRRPDGTPNRVQMKKPPALPLPAPIPTPPGSYPPPHRHAMEAPALSAAVAVVALPQHPGASAVTTYVIRGRQPLATELRTTFRKLAAPIAFVALFAISLSTYLAFAGNGGEVAVAAPAPIAAAAAPAPTPPPPAPKPAPIVTPAPEQDQEKEESAYASADRTGAEEPAPAATEEEIADDEIEMTAVDIERPKTKKRASSKQELGKAGSKVEKKVEPKKIEPKKVEPKKVEEGELPQNIANKTSSETGTILVTSNIPALIYLDGRNTRMMTPKQFAVPAGPHKITLLEPDTRKARTQDVKVLPGKTVAVEKQF